MYSTVEYIVMGVGILSAAVCTIGAAFYIVKGVRQWYK